MFSRNPLYFSSPEGSEIRLTLPKHDQINPVTPCHHLVTYSNQLLQLTLGNHGKSCNFWFLTDNLSI